MKPDIDHFDEPYISRIIIANHVVNMTTSTEMDTNTETASVSMANETMSNRLDETCSNRDDG
jgi:hypothetical protein